MIKTGQYVNITDGAKIDDFGEAHGWGGYILDIYKKEKLVEVRLDSATLNQLSDEFLLACYQDGTDPFIYIFNQAELVETEQVQEDEGMYEQAKQKIHQRIEQLIPEEEREMMQYIDESEAWMEELALTFCKSSFVQNLSEKQQELAESIAYEFLESIDNYADTLPQKMVMQRT